MKPERVYQAEAIVLRQFKLGEADKVLTIYTREYGKFRAIAKGVRKPGSRKSGHLDLLTAVQVQLAHGRTFDIITQAQASEMFLPLKSDLDRLSRGLYVAELLDAFTDERMTGRALYDLTLGTLQRLSGDEPPATTLRYFELQLVHLLGWQPELHRCPACATSLQPDAGFFHAASGGVVCPECARSRSGIQRISLPAFKVMRLWQDSPWETARRVRLETSLEAELERLLRHYLRYLLERDLKSADFLDRVRWELTAPPPPTPINLSQGGV
jgi:DNA repair protein RecO (recombination protein O)